MTNHIIIPTAVYTQSILVMTINSKRERNVHRITIETNTKKCIFLVHVIRIESHVGVTVEVPFENPYTKTDTHTG